MASLNAQVNYHVFDLFGLALPDEQHDPFTMDEEVAAWMILSLNDAPYEGLQEFLSAVGDLLISTSFVETALETAGMNEETFSCRHKPKHEFWDCVTSSPT